MMLEREDGIEAERLGEIAEREMLRDDLDIGAASLTQHVERNADFHRFLSVTRNRAA